MICQECGKRTATLHFTKIIQGNKTELHLCETCAREKGEFTSNAGNGFSIHQLLAGMLELDTPHKATISPKSRTLSCDTCGMTYAQFSKLGRFGCSECYQHFAERLPPLLKRVHGNTTHVGKVPQHAGSRVQLKRRIDQMKKDLQQLIEQEEFEAAARKRDEIRELEKQSPQSPT